MSKFLFAFHGGKMPKDAAAMQAIMSKWEEWMTSLGSNMIDPGSIVGNNHSLSTKGMESTSENAKITGYMIVASESMDAAMAIAQGCPILENGGSIQVAEMMSPP